MAHRHPFAPKWEHAFVCDSCGRVAGQHADESEALRIARQAVREDGWEWSHPGWVLTCPDCQTYEQEE